MASPQLGANDTMILTPYRANSGLVQREYGQHRLGLRFGRKDHGDDQGLGAAAAGTVLAKYRADRCHSNRLHF